MLARYLEAQCDAIDGILERAGVLHHFTDKVAQASAVPDVRERSQPIDNRPYAVN